MARTKRSVAAASTAIDDENADTPLQEPPQTKRPRRRASSRSKAAAQRANCEDALLQAIDEPVPAPVAETVSVEHTNIEELSIPFPLVGSSVYSKYMIPLHGNWERLDEDNIQELENWDADNDSLPTQSDAAQLDSVATDVLLLELPVDSNTYFPLPSIDEQRHIDQCTGRYIGPKRGVVAELPQALIQPVMTGRRPKISPTTATYVYQDGYGLQHESFELALPPSMDPATIASVTLNSFKSVEHTDPYFSRRMRVLPRGKKGERLNRTSGFLQPLPVERHDIHFRTLWVYPDSTHALIPADTLPFVQAQFTTTSDGIFHDGIRPDMMPFVRVVVRPIRGHKYPLPTSGNMTYTYMWSLYLRTDAINTAVESHDRAALAIIRNLLSLVTQHRNWLETFAADSIDSEHRTSIPSTSDPDIFALPTSLLSSITSLPSTDLNDTQRVCLAWLLKRELLDDRSIKVYPSNTTINTHLIRFGPNGAYYEPYTARFFTAAQRDSIRVLAQPEPPVSITCTDSILKTSGPFCPHKIGVVLALIQANPLQHPRPIPDRTRDLIPTRATLIVCTQASLAEWAVQARRKFPGPGQVLVMDSSQDYTAVTLAQVQAADVVLISDVFVLTLYNRNLLRMINSQHIGSDSVSLMPSYSHDLVSSFSPVLQPQPALLQVGCETVLDEEEPARVVHSFFSRHDDYWTSHHDDRDFPYGYHDQRPRTSLSELFLQAQRSGSFVTDQAASRPDPAVHTPIHLIFWHRLVLDGISFATSPSQANGGQHHVNLSSDFTPLRELTATSSVLIVPTPGVSPSTSPCSEFNSVNTLCTYRMLGINLPEVPSNQLSTSALTSLLRSISLSIQPPAHDSAQRSAIIVETIPVHLTPHEAKRVAIVSPLVGNCLALSVYAIQHHLVPLSFKPRSSASADHPQSTSSVMYDSLSSTQPSHMLFHKEWQQWHHLAAYRTKRRWPLYDDFLGPARADRAVDPSAVDDWMPTADCFTTSVRAAASFDADTRSAIRSVLSQTPAGVLNKMRDALHEFLTMCRDVANHSKLLKSTRARLVSNVEKLCDSWCRFRVGEMALERGFTIKEIEAIGMRVTERYGGAGATSSKTRLHRWFDYRRVEVEQDAKKMSAVGPPFVQGAIIKLLLELRMLLNLGQAITWAKDSVQLLALAVSKLDAPRPEASVCGHCQQAPAAETDAIVLAVCGFNGCSACADKHTVSCQSCQDGLDDGILMLARHCPKTRQRIEEEWAHLLQRHGAMDSVNLFCRQLSGISDSTMTCATTPMFVDIFGVKVQAVVMYILQQLDSDPSAKFLAFTEFTSQLHLLGLALHLVKVKAELVIDGAPVYLPIHSFKTDPRVRVLILPFTKCAAGINLSEATHVLLVHPFAGQFKTPWDRFGRAGLRFHLLAELPLVESTLNEAESNKNRMRVWAEWEQQCIEMVLQGRNSSAAVRIARFIIQHSVEQAFALHASASNKMGSRNVVDG